MENVAVDGKGGDWGDAGFGVEVIKQIWREEQHPSADDHNARFRLGWNDEGLLILAKISDDK